MRYHGQQIDTWRRQVLLSKELDGEQKLLARYQVLSEQVQKGRYPSCFIIAARSFYPQPDQLELILEGCLSKLLVKRNVQDVATAKRLAEDVLHIALCRANGALA